MKRRDDFDERDFRVRSRSPEPQEGSLFAEIQPPSVPVSSSERGADIAAKQAPSQNQRILLALRAAGCVPGSGKYLSREAIAERAGLTVNAACGRLGPSGSLVIASRFFTPSCCNPIISIEDACRSSAGVEVMGYALTPFGVRAADRLAKRQAA